MKNYHKWFGLVLRDKRSNFLSRDRSGVIFAFVMSTLAISAVFYGQPRDNIASFLTITLISALASGGPSITLKLLFSKCRCV